VFFMKQFRQYLLWRPFRVRSDHAALQWLRRTPEPTGQQSRWLDVLEEFCFEIEHRPGRKHENADTLSRRPCRQCGQCGQEETVKEVLGVCAIATGDGVVKHWSPEAIAKAQSEDPNIGPLYAVLTLGQQKPE